MTTPPRPRPRKRPRKRPQQPPLKRLADRQKHGDLNRLVSTVEAQIRAVFADAQAHVGGDGGILAQFAAAYAAEQKRLAELHDDEHARVPLHWLQTSGWGPRVTHALMQAHTSAAHTARRYILHSLTTAHRLGADDARDLLTLAMRPALKAGMRWQPK